MLLKKFLCFSDENDKNPILFKVCRYEILKSDYNTLNKENWLSDAVSNFKNLQILLS